MTRQDRQLLLQDLCARVPYHPKGHVVNSCNGAECDEWLTCETFTMFTNIMNNTRLYLRPMSSMTVEEKNELFNLCTMCDSSVNTDWESFGVRIVDTHPRYADQYYTDYSVIDWLNKKMFDYRGLIQSNLAIDCSNLNIYD